MCRKKCKTFGGFYEDNVVDRCRCYTFEDVEKEQHLFSASNEEHRIILEECANCAKDGDPKGKAMIVITTPGQGASDGIMAPTEPLRRRLALRPQFSHLKMGRGGAKAISFHFRSGEANIGPFDGLSREERKKAGQERLSLWTGDLASYHNSLPSALTTKPTPPGSATRASRGRS